MLGSPLRSRCFLSASAVNELSYIEQSMQTGGPCVREKPIRVIQINPVNLIYFS
jgi:hypothetical protein